MRTVTFQICGTIGLSLFALSGCGRESGASSGEADLRHACGGHRSCPPDAGRTDAGPAACVPSVCPAGLDCGSVPDGCGGLAACGTCTAPRTCGGGGTPNVCGTTATTCTPIACSAGQCGVLTNGCGGTIDCGECASGQTCGGGGVVHVCGSAVVDPALGDYYVSTTGSDSAAGTSPTTAFRTLQHAADVAASGSVVIVLPGTYAPSTNPAVYVTRPGITFRSSTPHGARLDGQSNTLSTGFWLGGGGTRVDGFEVSGFSGAGVSIWGDDISVVGNDIHDIGRMCTDTTLGQDGIYLSRAHRAMLARNVVHDIGRFGPGEHGCSPATGYYQNHDHGTYIEACGGVTLRDSIYYNITHGWAVHVYSSDEGPSSGLQIIHNTFAYPNPYRQGQVLFADPGVSDSVVENNVFYRPTDWGVQLSTSVAVGGFSNIVVRNNLVFGGTITSGATSGVTLQDNLPNEDPLLVAPATFDFHLTSGSPARAAGFIEATPTVDFDGQPRPIGSPPDLGALQYR